MITKKKMIEQQTMQMECFLILAEKVKILENKFDNLRKIVDAGKCAGEKEEA